MEEAGGKPLTILITVIPLANPDHARTAKEFASFLGGVFQTLLHLNPVVWPNELAHDGCITQGGIKGLVPPSFAVEDILANDSPVALGEGVLP